jgi:peptidoglycan L-alanyl-D-glutamate endopeptidase CwlK
MPKLSAASQRRLAGAHPLLRELFAAVAAHTAIVVLDSQRGRAAQERAFALGHSRAHFGQSAHNWAPAVALDVVPAPIDWTDLARFRALAALVKAEAAARKIPLAWGGDWPGLRDMPHYELDPWRAFAASAKPFGGSA